MQTGTGAAQGQATNQQGNAKATRHLHRRKATSATAPAEGVAVAAVVGVVGGALVGGCEQGRTHQELAVHGLQ